MSLCQSTLPVPTTHRSRRLADWSGFWGAPEPGSSEWETPRFTGGGMLSRTAGDVDEMRPGDFRLLPGSLLLQPSSLRFLRTPSSPKFSPSLPWNGKTGGVRKELAPTPMPLLYMLAAGSQHVAGAGFRAWRGTAPGVTCEISGLGYQDCFR